jgi:hypothetical protein
MSLRLTKELEPGPQRQTTLLATLHTTSRLSSAASGSAMGFASAKRARRLTENAMAEVNFMLAMRAVLCGLGVESGKLFGEEKIMKDVRISTYTSRHELSVSIGELMHNNNHIDLNERCK